MHFDFTITLGNIITIPSILLGVWRLERFIRGLDWLRVEHEILVRDYCKRMNIEIAELPTRLMKQ